MKTAITTTAIAIAAAAMLATDPANATNCSNGSKDYPKCTPTPATPAAPPASIVASPQVSSSSGALAGSASTATSGANAGSTSSTGPVSSGSTASTGPVTAAGGQGGAASVGDSTANATGAAAAGDSNAQAGGASLVSSDNSSTKAVALSFAPGASTPPLPVNSTCAVTIKQYAVNIGMGLFSTAQSSSDPRICHIIDQRNRFERMCLFASMKQLDDALAAELMPGFRPPAEMYAISNTDAGYVDMTPDKCAARRPPVIVVAPPAPAPAPAPTPAPAPEPRTVSLAADALFDFDRDVLKPEGKATLDALAKTLIGEAANVVIVGHTDAVGSDRYNDSLSMRRANAVRAHLALAGVDMTRMVALGKGKREPVADNRTPGGRAQNRRVEVQITVPQASKRLERLVAGT